MYRFRSFGIALVLCLFALFLIACNSNRIRLTESNFDQYVSSSITVTPSSWNIFTDEFEAFTISYAFMGVLRGDIYDDVKFDLEIVIRYKDQNDQEQEIREIFEVSLDANGDFFSTQSRVERNMDGDNILMIGRSSLEVEYFIKNINGRVMLRD